MIPTTWPRRPETVERLRAQTAPDRYTNEIPTGWVATPLPGVLVAPSTSADLIQPGRDGVVTDLTLLAPAGTDLTARDRIRYRGDEYSIAGDVADWSTGGGVGGLTIGLRRVAG